MNRKAFITGTLIVAVILLVGAAVGVPAVIGSSSNQTTQSDADISADRWVAMTEYYRQLETDDLTTLSEADIRADRWVAMTEYYSQLETGALTTLSEADVSAIRWAAMADYYSQFGTGDLTTRSADDIRAYPRRISPPGR